MRRMTTIPATDERTARVLDVAKQIDRVLADSGLTISEQSSGLGIASSLLNVRLSATPSVA